MCEWRPRREPRCLSISGEVGVRDLDGQKMVPLQNIRNKCHGPGGPTSRVVASCLLVLFERQDAHDAGVETSSTKFSVLPSTCGAIGATSYSIEVAYLSPNIVIIR